MAPFFSTTIFINCCIILVSLLTFICICLYLSTYYNRKIGLNIQLVERDPHSALSRKQATHYPDVAELAIVFHPTGK